jgi:superfamily II DNA/RNA helicase
VPHHPEDYVHRIGRTGRAGRSGTAITIVAPIDGKAVGAIERLIGETIPWMKGEPGPVAAREANPAQDGERPARSERPRDRHRDRQPAARRPKKEAAHKGPSHQAPTHKAPTHQPPPPVEDSEGGHLPAFLLRPVSVKA